MINLEIDELLGKSIKDKELELEFVFDNKNILNKSTFVTLLNYCKSNYEFIDDNNYLDIRVKQGYNKLSDERITVSNLHNIKKYCRNDILEEDVTFIKKENIPGKRYVSDDFDFKFNLKKEIELSDDDENIIKIKENWESLLKFFRYKKRYSFLLPNKLFRIDLTIVKSSEYNNSTKSYMCYQKFRTADILSKDELYEFEIEYIGNTIDDDKFLETYKSKGKDNNYQKLSPRLNYIDTKEISSDIDSIIGEYVRISDEFLKKKRLKGKLSGKQIAYVEEIVKENDLTYVDVRITGMNDLRVPITEISNDKFTIDTVLTEEINPSIISKILKELEEYVYTLLTVLYNTKILVSNKQRDIVLDNYYKLTEQKNRKVFMGPQPVTINYDSLDKNNFGSIIYDYGVTEKADGLRHLMYIGKDKIAYLINSKMNYVINTGIQIPVKGEWLLDGEYIQKNKNDEDIRLFMIFDVYWAEETPKPANKYPFIGDGLNRSDILDKLKEHLKKSKVVQEDIQTFRIDFKVYEYGISRLSKNKDNELLQKTIFKKSKSILDRASKGGYEYHIDGLIFLPVNIPVKSGEDMKPVDKISGTWDYNYKWKPPEENTIDFKIKIEKEVFNKKNKKIYKDKLFPYTDINDEEKTIKYYKKAKLIVSYDESKDDSIRFCMKMIKNVSRTKKEIKFDPNYEVDVGVTNIPLFENRMMTIGDKREFNDGDIVEFRYNEDAKNGMIWEPLKLRDDKIKPQFFLIANNVWSTIIKPITQDMIQGNYDLDDLKTDDMANNNLYYVDDVDSESKSLRRFHNYIKYQLITAICSLKSVSIMDTSIGRGGDITKYIQDDIDCNFLFGLDINSVNEACKRYTYNNSNKKTNTLFIQYDTSHNIQEKTGLIGDDDDIEYSTNIINILYGQNQSIPKEFNMLRKNMKRKALDKFDVISSQFTLHYYFKDQRSFKGYLSNLLDNCKHGGYFIGTCYDGKKIFDALKDKDRVEYINNDGKLIYSIEKKYDIDKFEAVEFGQRIDVFMDSIGETYSEYLVNFDMFVSIMNDNGFELHKPKMNSDYDIFDGPLNSFESILKGLDKNNKIFKKYKDDVLPLLKDKMLYDLSSYNNYFIFKRK
tara:strand:- start:4020 stop:7346 length:3327 start_codon:yes stop_codon:yes gene_type:complete